MELTFDELVRARPRELETLVARADAPDLDSLIASEWRGFNQPWVARLLGIRKFIKGFFKGKIGVEGYNVPVVQNGLNGPWIAKPSPEHPRRYAYYVVSEPGNHLLRARYSRAALLDYGATLNGQRWGVERLLRDFLVQPYPANPNLLLGKAYFKVGKILVPSSYFVLERIRPVASG